jgi:hypothetical protein
MGPDMIERHKRRLGGVVVLLAAAAVGGATGVFADTSTRQLVTGLIAFGLVNALVEVPGTWGVRAITIGTIAVSLVLQGESRTFAVSATLFMAWLVWPPAFLVAWALNREATATNERLAVRTSGHARIGVTAIIAAIVIGTVAYRLIFIHRLEQTAALFIGLPALMAVIVVWATSPRSATGVACKAVTIGLLISMIFLGEGMVCVAMSAPLFYGVAVLIGRSVDELRRRDRSTTLSVIVLLAFVPMSLEGVTALTSLDRDETIVETRVIEASPDAVARAITAPPRFERALPPYLRVGFPRPTDVRIERHGENLRWVIRMRGGEMRLDGMEPRAGDLVLALEEATPRLMRWRVLSDDSHMTHFLRWREAIVEWDAVSPSATRVQWTIRYRRELDPAWYFGPWERYAVRLAAAYLIDSVATP